MRRSPLLLLGPLLCFAGCFGSKDSALFSAGGAGSMTAGQAAVGGSGLATGGATGAQAGTVATAGSGAAATISGGSTGANGGSDAGAAGEDAGGGGAGGVGMPIVIPVVTDCSMVPEASVGENGHCYRVNYLNLTFSAAAEACHVLGGHLATISSEEENEFVSELYDGELWIGASDGQPDTMAGGTYGWVTEEPWTFADWQDGQPNAFEVDCPASYPESADCYEHCAFQDDGGSWNDRSCWHTLLSVCEWDVEPSEIPDPPPLPEERR